MPLRLVFMGTPDFAVPTLLELAGSGRKIAAVYTRAAKPGGRRGLELVSSPVEREARRLGLAVHTPASLKSADAQAAFAAHEADAAIVVAYGLILPKPVLDAPTLGCFNLHASLLPRWRGAAPINRAIMAGDAETGVTVMKMDEGLDTGEMAMIERVKIAADMTAGELHDALSRLGADLMARALGALERSTLQFTPQPAEGVTYAAKIDKAEARINWSRTAEEIERQVRAFNPVPGAWFEANGERIKLLQAAVGNHASGQPTYYQGIEMPWTLSTVDAAEGGHVEPPAVPEPVAALSRDAGSRDQCRRGGQTPGDTILNQLAALEFVHIGEGGDGRVGEARDRRLMGIDGRLDIRLDGVGDFPLAVERQRGSLRAPERGAEQEEREGAQFPGLSHGGLH